jgi:hypothetical protein
MAAHPLAAVSKDPLTDQVNAWSATLPASLRERDWTAILTQLGQAQYKDAAELARDAARPDGGWVLSTLHTADVIGAGAGGDFVLLTPSCECSSINTKAWLVGASGAPRLWEFESGLNAVDLLPAGFVMRADDDFPEDANCCSSVKQELSVQLGSGEPVESVRYLPGKLSAANACLTLLRLLDLPQEPRVDLSAVPIAQRAALGAAALICLEQNLQIGSALPNGGLALNLPGAVVHILWDAQGQRWTVRVLDHAR